MNKKFSTTSIALFSFLSIIVAQAPKYSNEFLSIGVGARALGMSNSYITSVNDVTAGYWNPAGLLGIKNQHQVALMHSEYFAGIAKYDYGACTAYIIDQLRENGFIVKYTHPNLLLISWANWCPSYVRNEIKKKTGIVIDGTGNRVDKNKNNNGDKIDTDENPNELMFHRKSANGEPTKPAKEYKSIDTYKPSGLIYNENLLRKIEDKTRQ